MNILYHIITSEWVGVPNPWTNIDSKIFFIHQISIEIQIKYEIEYKLHQN
jgi:hypothetical protein